MVALSTRLHAIGVSPYQSKSKAACYGAGSFRAITVPLATCCWIQFGLSQEQVASELSAIVLLATCCRFQGSCLWAEASIQLGHFSILINFNHWHRPSCWLYIVPASEWFLFAQFIVVMIVSPRKVHSNSLLLLPVPPQASEWVNGG